jgi:hypothetical protein
MPSCYSFQVLFFILSENKEQMELRNNWKGYMPLLSACFLIFTFIYLFTFSHLSFLYFLALSYRLLKCASSSIRETLALTSKCKSDFKSIREY